MSVETEELVVQGLQPPEAKRDWFRPKSAFQNPWIVAITALGIDQFVKNVIAANLERGASWPAEGFIRITHAWNTGAAFSLFNDQNGMLTVVSIAAVVMLAYYIRSIGNESKLARLGLALALGGAFGNIVDRLRLGHVTDIFDVGPWPIFNTADSAIVIGLTLVVLRLWRTENSERRRTTGDEAKPEIRE